MKKAISFLLCLLGLVGLVLAHQPRLVFQQEERPVVVQNPEISQAFYGILSGSADEYQIVSVTGFTLYVQIVVPMISGTRQDFVVHISGAQGQSWVLDGTKTVWSGFFEEYGGDWYLQGDTYEQYVGSGIYTIRVDAPGLTGKYSLAIGKIETFPPKEALHAFLSMPMLKVAFFGKSVFSAYSNYVGLYSLFTLLVVACIGYLLFHMFRKRG